MVVVSTQAAASIDHASDPEAIRPFRIEIPETDLNDLQTRLAAIRWPEEPPAREPSQGPIPPGWEYGVPTSYVRRLVERWCCGYDWRTWEARLNALPQYLTEIDGQQVHFLHIRSPHDNALPLILTHGWPTSVVEWLDVITPLSDPVTSGAEPADAFDLIIPSIPGFGFSGPTREPGWDRYRVARAWAELMSRLGYQKYGAVGNDAGSLISPEVGRADPEHVVGVHVTQIFSFASGDPSEINGLDAADLSRLRFAEWFTQHRGVYDRLQSTEPQNLAYALADSPVGQLGWHAQLLGEWLDPDFVLTNAAIYWLTNTAASAARFYYEDAVTAPPQQKVNGRGARKLQPTTVPIGLANFAFDYQSIRPFAERDHANITSWNVYERGSHFPAQDAADLLVDDIRQFFHSLR